MFTLAGTQSHVLRLYVAMQNPMVVAVRESPQNLEHIALYRLETEPPSSVQIETNPNPEVNTQDVARMRSILVHLKNSDSGPAIPSEE